MIKNYKKLFLSFGAAAVLSSAAAFSSLAASGGWVSENGVWKYQEASGNYAYIPGKLPVITLTIWTITASLL